MGTNLAAPVALALGLAVGAAPAQTIYRCGDTYSQAPCAGASTLNDAAPAPSAAERKQAAAATQRDARLADALEKDRLRQEARPAQLYIPPPKAEALPEPHKWPEKAATRKLDVFTASAPGSKPAQKQTNGKSAKAAPKAAPAAAKPAPAGKLAAAR